MMDSEERKNTTISTTIDLEIKKKLFIALIEEEITFKAWLEREAAIYLAEREKARILRELVEGEGNDRAS